VIEVNLARALGRQGGLELDELDGVIVARCGGLEGRAPSETEARRDLVAQLIHAAAQDHLELVALRPPVAPTPASVPVALEPSPELVEPVASSWRVVPVVSRGEVPPGAPILVPIAASAPFTPHRLVLEHPEWWYVLRIDHDGRSCLKAQPVEGERFSDDRVEPVEWPAIIRPDGPSILLYVSNRTATPRALRASLWGLGEAAPATATPPAQPSFDELLAAAEER